jgi:hypothetical protein
MESIASNYTRGHLTRRIYHHAKNNYSAFSDFTHFLFRRKTARTEQNGSATVFGFIVTQFSGREASGRRGK